MTPTEEQLRDLLQRAAPDVAAVRFDDVVGRVHERRRATARMASAAIGVVLVAVVAVVLGTQASIGTPSPRSRAAQATRAPALTAATQAQRSGAVGVSFSFAPPRDPQAAISPQSALNRAWSSFGRQRAHGATGARLTLAYVSRHATHTDVWVVVFNGACLVQVTETSYPSHKPCVHEPVTDVVDASNGQSLFGFTGSPTMTLNRSSGTTA